MADAQTIINYMAQRIAQLETEKAILLAERDERAQADVEEGADE